jgi:hypothetical protein
MSIDDIHRQPGRLSSWFLRAVWVYGYAVLVMMFSILHGFEQVFRAKAGRDE